MRHKIVERESIHGVGASHHGVGGVPAERLKQPPPRRSLHPPPLLYIASHRLVIKQNSALPRKPREWDFMLYKCNSVEVFEKPDLLIMAGLDVGGKWQ